MKKLTITLLLALGYLAAGAQGNGTYHYQTLMIDNKYRSYTVYEPQGYAGEELPVVFNFHGFSSSPTSQIYISEMYLVADTAKFFVVYPQGELVTNITGLGTNTGWYVPDIYIADHDDVAFVSAMIDSLVANPDFAIDTNRIHATGMSNGAGMTYYLACTLSDRIASNAGVVGQMTYLMMDSICTPDRSVSVLHLLGTNDPFFPVNGNSMVPPLEGTAEYWALQDNCDTIPFPIQLPDTDTTDGSTVTLLSYPSCYQGYEVRCYRIEGGGHMWPGGGQVGLPGTNNDINASVEIWNFFKRNPHPRSYPFCLPDGIAFTSQQDIDEFQDYYPNCAEIQGDVKISGDDIINLNGLNQVTNIGGNLTIYGNDSLVDFTGLENLSSIGGNLNIGKDLHPWGTSGNPSLTSLSGLDGLTSIGSNLFIAYNPSLTDLLALDSLSAGSIDSLFVFDNMSLATCNANSVCDYLLNYGGFREIHDNDVGCDSPEEVALTCTASVDESSAGSWQSAFRVYPNPASGNVNCQFSVVDCQRVTIKLYDLYGREVARVVDEVLPEGEYVLRFDASEMSPGVYIWRQLAVGSWQLAAGKLIIIE